MSILLAYSILDVKTSAFSPPMFYPTTPAAIRAFGAAARDGQSDISKFAEDYVLYEIGSYDTDLAYLTGAHNPKVICKALDFKVDKPD